VQEKVDDVAITAIRVPVGIATLGSSEIALAGYGKARATYEGYQQDGAVGAGIAFVNTVNPLYGLGATGTRLYVAVDGGDPEKIGAAAVPAIEVAAGVVAGRLAGVRLPSGARRAPWRVGDDIYAPTATAGAPNWNTVRARFWKNEATSGEAAQRYGAANVERMKRGLAPQRYNDQKGGMESMDLSHEPTPARNGGTNVVPRWPQDHAKVDKYRRPGY